MRTMCVAPATHESTAAIFIWLSWRQPFSRFAFVLLGVFAQWGAARKRSRVASRDVNWSRCLSTCTPRFGPPRYTDASVRHDHKRLAPACAQRRLDSIDQLLPGHDLLATAVSSKCMPAMPARVVVADAGVREHDQLVGRDRHVLVGPLLRTVRARIPGIAVSGVRVREAGRLVASRLVDRPCRAPRSLRCQPGMNSLLRRHRADPKSLRGRSGPAGVLPTRPGLSADARQELSDTHEISGGNEDVGQRA